MLKFLAICLVPIFVAGMVILFRYDLGHYFEQVWELFVVAGNEFARWLGQLFEAPGL